MNVAVIVTFPVTVAGVSLQLVNSAHVSAVAVAVVSPTVTVLPLDVIAVPYGTFATDAGLTVPNVLSFVANVTVY